MVSVKAFCAGIFLYCKKSLYGNHPNQKDYTDDIKEKVSYIWLHIRQVWCDNDETVGNYTCNWIIDLVCGKKNQTALYLWSGDRKRNNRSISERLCLGSSFVREGVQAATRRAMIERKSNRYPSGHSRQILHSKSDRRLFGKVSSLTRRVKAANGSIPVLSTQLNGNLETEHTILSSGHDTEPPGEHPRTHCLYEFGRKFVEQEGSNVGLFASGSRVIERKFTVCGSNN